MFSQFCKLGFANNKDFEKGFTRKFPNINPIMKLGFEKELTKVNSIVNSYENLHLVGGAAEFAYGDVQVMFSKARDMVDLLSSEHYVINKNIKAGTPFTFNEEVKIGKFLIGGNNPTLIIAEIGINHQGDINMAKQLIMEAKNSGCDYAKIQTYTTNKRISPSAKSAKYADKTLDMEETTYEMLDRLSLDELQHKTLFNYAKQIDMPLISTPFDEESVDMLMNLNIDAFKLSSFDTVNLPLIKYVALEKKTYYSFNWDVWNV